MPIAPPRRAAVLTYTPIEDVETTLQTMWALAHEASLAPWCISQATQAQRHLRLDDYDSHAAYRLARLQALWRWMRNHVAYINDGAAGERVQSPEVTLRERAGDCDDQATLLAAMILATFDVVETPDGAAWPATFAVCGEVCKQAGEPAGRWVHVYVVADCGGQLVPLDPTARPGFAFGETPGVAGWAHAIWHP